MLRRIRTITRLQDYKITRLQNYKIKTIRRLEKLTDTFDEERKNRGMEDNLI